MSSGADKTLCDNCEWELSCTRPGKYSVSDCKAYMVKMYPTAITFIDKLKEALPTGPSIVHAKKAEKFSLDKLIDDHWGYISNLIDVTQMHSNPKEKAIAEFHYKTAAVHFWKHCCEHYGIEEKK